MDEEMLWEPTRKWLDEKYSEKGFSFLLRLRVFHSKHMSITDYLMKKLALPGRVLQRIPAHADLIIRPDVMGVVKLPKTENRVCAWIVVECKSKDTVAQSDLREALDWAWKSHAYEAYLVYEGNLSSEVRRSIRKGGLVYLGTDAWGKPVKKKLLLYHHDPGGGFRKTSIASL